MGSLCALNRRWRLVDNARHSKIKRGDHRGGDVFATHVGTVAPALPVIVVEKQGDAAADHPAARGDAEDRLVLGLAIEEDDARAVQLDAARPLRRRARFAHGLEDSIDLLSNRVRQIPSTDHPDDRGLLADSAYHRARKLGRCGDPVTTQDSRRDR